MAIKLDRPLIVFDLETTGLDIATAHIIQIAYIKVMPSGEEISVSQLINPGRPIPPEVQELTHITDEMVKDKPTFKEMASKLEAEFKGCDFAGFNSNNYDIPLLMEEFARVGITFDMTGVRMIDAFTIFTKMEPRNLAAAYKFYCGRKMEDDFQAHLADQDTAATWAVLKGELEMYSAANQDEEDRVLSQDLNDIHQFCNPCKKVDFAGKFIIPEGGTEPIITFGKHKNKTVREVLMSDPGYYSWMMQGDFTLNTKQMLTALKLKYRL